ncbi:FlaG family protein [Hydrogenimonas cancrithermarum]|uniref:Flagellar protein FlaG n=1 Tax=Hydrogenimonas cancrithermarum TaxID=2993563 RepID=A0ABN6WSG7_9BACT|nr:FlaG family protein [Hydrogenimonas cancrithermarum]BDY12004.1 flagellar protein FlaG [Hydrogenimonas cancrithermarum]
MEIFNTMRSQQPQPTTSHGVGNAHKTVSQTQKSSQQMAREEVQQSERKADTQKLKKQLQEITDQLNKEMNPLNTSIRFGFNDKVEEMYVSVIDTSTDQEIRKIPSEEAMRLAAKMRELVGMIFDKKG